jgi:hypothetical protein
MSFLDIGTLKGTLELEDNFTSVLKVAEAAVGRAGTALKGFGVVTAGALGVAAGAIAGYAASITALGEKGSIIIGVEDAFARLAERAGQTGDVLIGKLNEGLRNTVDSMVLMEGANKALSAGVKLTGDDMRVLGATAREMAKTAGTDAATEISKLFNALTTGRTRALQMSGVTIDLEKAQKKFADSLGVTVDKLNDAGKLEAARIAILETSRKRLDELGESQLSFKERIDQVRNTMNNWWDDLSKGIARSPAINQALETISTNIQKIFSENGGKAVEFIVSGLEKVGSIIMGLAPAFDVARTAISAVIGVITTVIDNIKIFWNWLVEMNERFGVTDKIAHGAVVAFNFLKDAFYFVRDAVIALMNAWNSMPDWLQRLTIQAVAATLALKTMSVGIGAISSPIRAVITEIDLAINIVGNLSGALVQLPLAYQKITTAVIGWTVSQRAAEIATIAQGQAMVFWKALAIEMDVQIGRLIAKLGIYEALERVSALTTRALAAAKLFLSNTMTALIINYNALLMRLGLYESASRIATVSTRGLAAAKGFLASTALALSLNFQALAMRFGLMGTAAAGAGVALRGLSVGMVGLGTVIGGITGVLIPLTLAVTLLWGAWELFTIGPVTRFFEAVDTKAKSLLGVIEPLTWAEIRNAQAAKLAAEEHVKLGKSFDFAADIARRTQELLDLQGELSGERLAQDVQKLVNAYRNLTPEQQKAADVMKRTGEQALALREAGAKLPADLNALADAAAKARPQFGGLGDALSRFTDLGTEGADAARNMGAGIGDLTKVQYEQIAAALKAGKAETDIAVVYKTTAAHVKAVSLAEKELADVREFETKTRRDALELFATIEKAYLADQRQRANEAMNQVGKNFLETQRLIQQASREATLIGMGEYEKRRELLYREFNDDIARFKGSRDEYARYLAARKEMLRVNLEQINHEENKARDERSQGVQVETKNWKEGLSSVADTFKTLAKIAGDSMGGIVGGIGTAITAIDGLVNSLKDAGEGFAAGAFEFAQVFSMLASLQGPGLALAKAMDFGGRALTRQRAEVGRIGTYDAPTTELDKLIEQRELMKSLAQHMHGSALDKFQEQIELLQERIEKLSDAEEAAAEKTRKYEEALSRLGLTADDLLTPTERAQKQIQQLGEDLEAIGDPHDIQAVARQIAGPLNEALRTALSTGQKLPAAFRPFLEALIRSGKLSDDLARKMLGLPVPDAVPWRDMEDAANRYGISLDALGGKFQQSKLTEGAQQLIADWNILVNNGADVNAVMDGMQEQVQALIDNAQKFGLEIPAAMRPMLEAMVKAGRLTDESGEALEDLSSFKFSEDLTTKIEDLVAALDDLVDVLSNIPSPVITPEIRDPQRPGDRPNPTPGQRPPNSPNPNGPQLGDRDPLAPGVHYDPPPLLASGDPQREAGAQDPRAGYTPDEFAIGSRGLRYFDPSGELVKLHGMEEVLTQQQSEGVATMVARTLANADLKKPQPVNVEFNAHYHGPDADGWRRLWRSRVIQRELLQALSDNSEGFKGDLMDILNVTRGDE